MALSRLSVSLCAALTLTACRTNQPVPVKDLPPSPPGLAPKMALETPTRRVERFLTVPEGFRMQNPVIGDHKVTLAWSGGTPPFQVESSDITDGWSPLGLPTMSSSYVMFSSNDVIFRGNQFFRSKQQVPLGVFLTNQTLTFTVPTLMSDSYKGTLRLYKSTDGVNRTGILTQTPPVAGSVTQADTQSPPVTYGIDDGSGGQIVTTNGVVIPFSPAIVNNTSPGSVLWAVSRSTGNNEFAYSIALDGTYVNVVGLDTISPIIVKYLIGSATGSETINKSYAQYGSANGVAVDSGHNIYIAAGQVGINDNYDPSQWLTKLNSSGTDVWHKTENGITGAIEAYGVCVDSNGDILVCGGYWGTVNFGDGAVNGPGVFGYAGFSAKYHSDGSLAWKKLYSATTSITPTVVRVDSGNNVFIGGRFNGTTPDSPNAGTLGGPGITSVGGTTSPFLAKYHSDGTFVFSSSIAQNSRANVQIGGMSVSRDGHVAVCGVYTSAADFGGGQISAAPGNSASGGYLVVYDCSGISAVWKWNANLIDQTLATLSYAVASGVGFDTQNNIAITGEFVGFVNFSASTVLTAQHTWDLFIAKYDINGVLKWANGYTVGTSTSATGQGFDVTMDSSLNVYCTGVYSGGTVPFGSFPLTWSGNNDIFIVKLAP